MHITLFTKRCGRVHYRRGTPLTAYTHKLLSYKHISHLFATLPNTRHVVLVWCNATNAFERNQMSMPSISFFCLSFLFWRDAYLQGGGLRLVPYHIAPAAPITLTGILLCNVPEEKKKTQKVSWKNYYGIADLAHIKEKQLKEDIKLCTILLTDCCR